MPESILTNFQYSRMQQRFTSASGVTPTVFSGSTSAYTEYDKMVLNEFRTSDILEAELFQNSASKTIYSRAGSDIFVVNNGISNVTVTGNSLTITQKDDSSFTVNLNALSIEQKTYAELLTMVSEETLTVGSKYILTDFQTVHNILDGSESSGDINTGTIEPLILTAIETYKFDNKVISTLFPQDIIYYDFTGGNINDIAFFDGGVAIPNLKGIIYYRKDLAKNVECFYDFRTVVYRRWLVGATAWASAGTYVVDNIYEYNDILYKCVTAHSGVTTTPDLDFTNWMFFLNKVNKYSFSSDAGQFASGICNAGNLSLSSPSDYLTFGDNFSKVHDVYLPRIDSSIADDIDFFSILSNNVFYTIADYATCYNNIFEGYFVQNTFGNLIHDNKVKVNSAKKNIVQEMNSTTINGLLFTNNIIYAAFQYNTINGMFSNNLIQSFFELNDVKSFQYNNIGDYFHANICGEYFYNNFIKGNFGTDNNNLISGNILGERFGNNKIGYNFIGNKIGNNFGFEGTIAAGNIIGDEFKNNIIGNDCYSNNIGTGAYNIIGNLFHSNTTTDLNSNIIKDNFGINSIGNDFSYNVIGADFVSNTILASFRYNNFLYPTSSTNFSAATHVYENYNCEVTKNAAGTLRLKYLDSNDIIVYTDITA